MSPLRITLAQGAFLPVPPLLGGAVEKVWFALGQEFARQGHHVVHVGRSHPDLPDSSTENGVTYLRVRGYDTPSSMWRLKAMDLLYTRRVRRALPPADILVTNTFWLPVLERRRSRGLPYVHVARYPKGQLKLYPSRSILQTVSAPIRDAILREVPKAGDRVRLVPYPLAPAYLVERDARKNVILYTGRIHPEKGLHLLIDAFLQVQAQGEREWKLRIIGPWKTSQGGGGAAYRQQLVDRAAAARGQIELLDPIFSADGLVSHYREAAIFAYPSLAEFGETFGLSVLEAMAGGCVPVVSALGCFGDFVRSNDNGVIFNHRGTNPAGELAHELEALMRSPETRERLSASAWQTARNYTLPVVARQYLADFRAVLGVPPQPTSVLEPCLPR
jgi:glycosyltransferase involved in cell wall biosynthesis